MTSSDRFVAERELLRDDGVTVFARVELPEPMAGDGDDWICRWRLETESGEEIYSLFSAGVDSMQALTLALTMMGERLKHGGETYTFLGSADLHFPLTPDSAD